MMSSTEVNAGGRDCVLISEELFGKRRDTREQSPRRHDGTEA
jgi:hypothetical protein